MFGHGGSFNSIRAVIEYKNRAEVQNPDSIVNLDSRFIPLGLSPQEKDGLEHFLKTGLYDNELTRYQPVKVPSGLCVIVDPMTVETHGLCPDELIE